MHLILRTAGRILAVLTLSLSVTACGVGVDLPEGPRPDPVTYGSFKVTNMTDCFFDTYEVALDNGEYTMGLMDIRPGATFTTPAMQQGEYDIVVYDSYDFEVCYQLISNVELYSHDQPLTIR